jgi:TolA-binding protein
MVDRPEFLTNQEVQSFDEPLVDVDRTPPEGATGEDEAEVIMPEHDENDAGERASVSSKDVPEPDPATPIARSISTPENLNPYDFGADVSREFMETYKQGLSLFEEGNYHEAERVFQRLQISDPPDDYADNTQYWIGECKFGMGQYQESIRAFEEVFIYPNTNKVDDSLIMMASAYINLNDMQEAAEILRKFQGQYSNSQYAPIAQRWLDRYNL